MLNLDANGARITPALFRAAFNRLDTKPEAIECHPYQAHAYEECGFARVTLDLAGGEMPGFDGAPFAEPITVNGVPIRSNIKLPKTTVKFLANGEVVGEITNLAEPVFE